MIEPKLVITNAHKLVCELVNTIVHDGFSVAFQSQHQIQLNKDQFEPSEILRRCVSVATQMMLGKGELHKAYDAAIIRENMSRGVALVAKILGNLEKGLVLQSAITDAADKCMSIMFDYHISGVALQFEDRAYQSIPFQFTQLDLTHVPTLNKLALTPMTEESLSLQFVLLLGANIKDVETILGCGFGFGSYPSSLIVEPDDMFPPHIVVQILAPVSQTIVKVDGIIKAWGRLLFQATADDATPDELQWLHFLIVLRSAAFLNHSIDIFEQVSQEQRVSYLRTTKAQLFFQFVGVQSPDHEVNWTRKLAQLLGVRGQLEGFQTFLKRFIPLYQDTVKKLTLSMQSPNYYNMRGSAQVNLLNQIRASVDRYNIPKYVIASQIRGAWQGVLNGTTAD